MAAVNDGLGSVTDSGASLRRHRISVDLGGGRASEDCGSSDLERGLSRAITRRSSVGNGGSTGTSCGGRGGTRRAADLGVGDVCGATRQRGGELGRCTMGLGNWQGDTADGCLRMTLARAGGGPRGGSHGEEVAASGWRSPTAVVVGESRWWRGRSLQRGRRRRIGVRRYGSARCVQRGGGWGSLSASWLVVKQGSVKCWWSLARRWLSWGLAWGLMVAVLGGRGRGRGRRCSSGGGLRWCGSSTIWELADLVGTSCGSRDGGGGG